ncbi:MAG: T9SS type A sorting domain-containing protein [Calditrichaceae bacterium]|nr:T9SS type A sorting domain-containing protein [Calditrichia bacterium]NUQ42779.1 T9SS type A sorting domain-containing protein [Calditrichaceae bacterium]
MDIPLVFQKKRLFSTVDDSFIKTIFVGKVKALFLYGVLSTIDFDEVLKTKKQEIVMKLTTFTFIFLSIIPLLAGDRHLPWSHTHTGNYYAPCYGYAMARAYNRSWNHSVCPAHSMPGEGINSNYFYKVNLPGSDLDYRDIQVGDILTFGNHAAYVRAVPDSSTRQNNSDSIFVDHKLGPSDPYERLNETLSSVIGLFGDPVFIYRKWPRWEITVKNSFTGGQVKVNNISHNSPWTEPNLAWESWISLNAIEDGNTYGGFIQRFQDWKKNGALQTKPKATSVEITDDYTQMVTWEAWFKNEYNIIFQNNFVGVGNPGSIKVGSTSYSSPTTEFYVLDGSTIIGEAINQTYNSISYTFSYWSDGTNTYPNRVQTFLPNGHKIYTAHFTGKPVRVQNLHNVAPVGSPIQLVWDEHPNSNCTYQIWRRIKELYGTLGDPVLLATKSHGTTSYTDNNYIRTSSYTEYLLSYDVRAYYTIESTTADPWWYTLYGGDPLWKDPAAGDSVSQHPATFELANYPNPFNPATTIHFRIPEQADITMVIYNSRGQRIKMLLNEPLSPGDHTIQWNGITEDGRPAASGIYWLRLESKAFTATRKLLLIR